MRTIKVAITHNGRQLKEVAELTDKLNRKHK